MFSYCSDPQKKTMRLLGHGGAKAQAKSCTELYDATSSPRTWTHRPRSRTNNMDIFKTQNQREPNRTGNSWTAFPDVDFAFESFYECCLSFCTK